MVTESFLVHISVTHYIVYAPFETQSVILWGIKVCGTNIVESAPLCVRTPLQNSESERGTGLQSNTGFTLSIGVRTWA